MTDSIPLENPDQSPYPAPPASGFQADETVSANVACPSCTNQIQVAPNSDVAVRGCPYCRKKTTIRVFPRLFVPEKPKAATGELSHDGDATCSFYPELKAEHVCDECGCFMSEKASISWTGKTLCLPCLHSLREKKGKNEYRASVRIYDNMALGLTVPFLVFFPLAFVTLFTAPAALYYLLRYRKSSRGLIPRTSFRWWVALFVSLAVNGAWIALIVTWIVLVTQSFTS